MGPVGFIAFWFEGGGVLATLQDDFLRRAARQPRLRRAPVSGICSLRGRARVRVGPVRPGHPRQQPVRPEADPPPIDGTGTLSLPTKEYLLGGNWVTVTANWVLFTDWSMCFAPVCDCCREQAESIRTMPLHWQQPPAKNLCGKFRRPGRRIRRGQARCSPSMRPITCLLHGPCQPAQPETADSTATCDPSQCHPALGRLASACFAASCDVPPSPRWCESASPAAGVPLPGWKDWRGTTPEPHCREADSGWISSDMPWW